MVVLIVCFAWESQARSVVSRYKWLELHNGKLHT